jgi:hypothetical protein
VVAVTVVPGSVGAVVLGVEIAVYWAFGWCNHRHAGCRDDQRRVLGAVVAAVLGVEITGMLGIEIDATWVHIGSNNNRGGGRKKDQILEQIIRQ